MELLKNLEGLSADEQMTAVVELQKAAMKHLEEQKQASIGKSAELVIQGLKKIKSDFEAKFDSLNYDIQTKVASLKDGEQGLQGPKGDQGERGLDGSNGRDGRDGKDGKDGVDGVDGVGVRDAKIDFDGSLVISLTDGREINCGEVVSVDVAKQIQKVTHNIQTGSGGDSQTVLDAIAALQATIATYGTMATQNANNVAITGGAINNTTIGATTPSTGVFTTLTATGTSYLGGSSTSRGVQVDPVAGGTTTYTQFTKNTGINEQQIIAANTSNLGLIATGGGTINFYTASNNTQKQLVVAATSTAVNYVQVTGAATGSRPTISSQGSDTTLGLNIQAKGTSNINFLNNNGSNTIFVANGNAGTVVNYLQSTAAVASSAPSLSSQGSDTNIDLNLTTKGTGAVNLNTGGGTQFSVANTASATNYFATTGSNGGTPALYSAGASTNIGANFVSKGTGALAFYTNGSLAQAVVSHTASAVNYVQVTGAATGSFPTISTQGSDSNVALWLTTKGTSAMRFLSQNGSYTQLRIDGSVASANSLNIIGGASGFGPVLTAQGADTNIPLVLQPLGTGALQAQQTDSTATGGNARGANAVDWQTVRTGAATQVASGSSSFIGGGRGNTSSSQDSFVGGGYQNLSSSSQSVVAGGANNQATAPQTFVGSGLTNYATRDYSGVVVGSNNSALGYYNFIGGGATNSGTANTAVTTQSSTMNGTTAVTLGASNGSIKVGQLVTGTFLTFPTYVAAVSGTSLTLSQNASGSGTSTLSFFTPHGVVVGGGNNQATGAYSFIGGGGDAGTAANRNVASGDWSTVAGGIRNSASGLGSFIGGGGTDGTTALGNVANTTSASVIGGANNIASGVYSVTGGRDNTADGNRSTAWGSNAWTRSIRGIIALSACQSPIGAAGVSQSCLLIIAKQTTDATATVLTSNGSAASTDNQVILPNNSAYAFRGEVVSGVTGGGNSKSWTIEGLIKRGANAASTTLVGSTVTSMYADAGAVTWTIALSADTTNGGLAVTFTGQAATTIRTVCRLNTTEMTY